MRSVYIDFRICATIFGAEVEFKRLKVESQYHDLPMKITDIDFP